MAQYDIIKASDYNAIQTVIATELGTGSGRHGYGQVVQSAQVSLDTRISVNEWTLLYYDFLNVWNHQKSTQTAVPAAPNVGDFTSWLLKDNFSTLATTLSQNTFSYDPVNTIARSKGSGSQTWPGPLGTSWRQYLYCTISVSWPTANEARYFFNSSGTIRFSSSRSGGTNSSQNSSWSDLLTSVGSVTFNGVQFYTTSSTNSYTRFYAKNATGAYSSNNFDISVKCQTLADNSNGGETTLVFLVEWYDSYVPGQGSPWQSSWATPDQVDGTITVNVSTLEATGSLLPGGTFTVTSPTVTINPIIQSA